MLDSTFESAICLHLAYKPTVGHEDMVSGLIGVRGNILTGSMENCFADSLDVSQEVCWTERTDIFVNFLIIIDWTVGLNSITKHRGNSRVKGPCSYLLLMLKWTLMAPVVRM